jgi:hypothetical protein
MSSWPAKAVKVEPLTVGERAWRTAQRRVTAYAEGEISGALLTTSRSSWSMNEQSLRNRQPRVSDALGPKRVRNSLAEPQKHDDPTLGRGPRSSS